MFKMSTFISESLYNLKLHVHVYDLNLILDNFGCRGGWMNNAYRYIKDAGGIDKETCYPYKARVICTFFVADD